MCRSSWLNDVCILFILNIISAFDIEDHDHLIQSCMNRSLYDNYDVELVVIIIIHMRILKN